MIAHGRKQISEMVYARKASEGGGAVRLTNMIRGGAVVFGGLSPSFRTPYSDAATRALKAAFSAAQWAIIKDYGFAHPEIVGYMNAYAVEDPKIAYSLVPTLGVRRRLVFTGTQYFLVGLLSTQVDEVEYEFVPDVTTGHIVCGGRSAASGSYKIYLEMQSSTNYFRIDWNNLSENLSLLAEVGHSYSVHGIIRDGYQMISINGTTYKTGTEAMPTSSFQNTIGAWNGNGSITAQLKGKLGRTILRMNGTDVRDYVPFIRNGIIGFLDMLSGTFYQNAGSGSFTITETPSNQTP